MPMRTWSPSPARVLSLGYRLHDGQSGPRGPLGLILMRPWPAKIREHPVTHELCDMALEPGHLARHSVLIEADDLAHIFRIKPGSHRSRAD